MDGSGLLVAKGINRGGKFFSFSYFFELKVQAEVLNCQPWICAF